MRKAEVNDEKRILDVADDYSKEHEKLITTPQQ